MHQRENAVVAAQGPTQRSMIASESGGPAAVLAGECDKLGSC